MKDVKVYIDLLYSEFMKELIDSISQEVTSQSKKFAEYPLKISVADSSKLASFSEKNFRNIRLDSSKKEIVFVDGGSSEIISSNSFSLHVMRVGSAIYSENKKVQTFSKEYFVLTKTDFNNEKLTYISKIFDLSDSRNHKIVRFDASDRTLKDGINNGEITKVGGVVRRFMELDFAKTMLKKVSQHSILLLDGSLQCTFSGEEKYMESLISSAISRNVLVMAISKTNSLISDTGASVDTVLKNMSCELGLDSKMWFYHPLASVFEENYSADIIMAKLHKRSKHILKVEISNKYKLINYNKIFGCLALNSGDPVFIGYPYGLIKADEIARVSNDVSSYYRVRFMRNLNLEELESSKNAHSILDKIKF